MTKRRTKPAQRIWAVWYWSQLDDSLLVQAGFLNKRDAYLWGKPIEHRVVEIICYERRSR